MVWYELELYLAKSVCVGDSTHLGHSRFPLRVPVGFDGPAPSQATPEAVPSACGARPLPGPEFEPGSGTRPRHVPEH